MSNSCPIRLQETGGSNQLAAGDDAARLQDALHLSQRRLSVGDVHQNGVAVRRVEIAVLEWQFRRAADMENGIRMPSGLGCALRHLDLGRFHIDAVHLARLYRSGKAYGNRARSATEIENAHAGL